MVKSWFLLPLLPHFHLGNMPAWPTNRPPSNNGFLLNAFISNQFHSLLSFGFCFVFCKWTKVDTSWQRDVSERGEREESIVWMSVNELLISSSRHLPHVRLNGWLTRWITACLDVCLCEADVGNCRFVVGGEMRMMVAGIVATDDGDGNGGNG